MSAEIAFKDGYLKDEWSRLVEPVHRGVEGRAFLWTGRQAEVGQRTETQITTADGSWCRLSGVVTAVGEMPTLEEWREGNSCQLPPGVKSMALPIDQQLLLRDDFIGQFGTLHGQKVTSYSFLNPDFYDRQEGLPFKRAKVYKISIVCDENMSFVWCVTRIEDVTGVAYEELPEVFRKWQEGSFQTAKAYSVQQTKDGVHAQ